jgi:hypothetical protein
MHVELRHLALLGYHRLEVMSGEYVVHMYEKRMAHPRRQRVACALGRRCIIGSVPRSVEQLELSVRKHIACYRPRKLQRDCDTSQLHGSERQAASLPD